MTETDNILQATTENYREEHIITPGGSIRRRPGMYIGNCDGSSPDDGIYVLLKEVPIILSTNI